MVSVAKTMVNLWLPWFNNSNYPDILLNNNMINFTDWRCKGIKYLEHILEGTDFIPFDKLIKQYGIWD